MGADPGIQEFDLEGSIADRPCLPDELVHTRFAHTPPPFSVHVKAMVGPGRSTIELDAEADGVTLGRRSQDEVKIASVKAIGDAAGVVQRRVFASDRPDPRQAPVVERQGGYSPVEARSVFADAAGRREIRRVVVADISLGRAQIRFIRRGLGTLAADRYDIAR